MFPADGSLPLSRLVLLRGWECRARRNYDNGGVEPGQIHKATGRKFLSVAGSEVLAGHSRWRHLGEPVPLEEGGAGEELQGRYG